MCSSFSGLDGDFHTAYFTSLAWTSCWDLDFQKPLSCGHLSILSTMKYSNSDSSSASLPLHPVLHFSSRFWLHHSHICPSLDEPFICRISSICLLFSSLLQSPSLHSFKIHHVFLVPVEPRANFMLRLTSPKSPHGLETEVRSLSLGLQSPV